MTFRYTAYNIASKIKAPFSQKQRKKRMIQFVERMNIKGGEKIIDLGGLAGFWNDCPYPLKITIINLPGSGLKQESNPMHEIDYIEGDACDMPFVSSKSYDIAFSNSVIEHVGPVENQEAFAKEAQRVANRYWIQTPSIWFPIEAHNNMPFWWFYPEPLKSFFLARWREKLPAWAEMIEGTTVISRSELKRMFPTGRIWTEKLFGVVKSYVVYN